MREQGWNPNHRTLIHKVKWMQNLLEQDLLRTIARLPFFLEHCEKRLPRRILKEIWLLVAMSTKLAK